MGKAETREKEITLAAPTKADHWHCVDLRNANKQHFFSPGHVTLASHHEWYKQVAGDSARVFYVVKLDGDVIDTIGLSRIDYYHEHAEYGQFVIGERWRGKGYGRRALRVLAWKAFGEFGLRRLWGDILAENLRGIQTAHSVGFVLEGLFGQHVKRDGEFFDVVRVGLLRSIFDGVSRYVHTG